MSKANQFETDLLALLLNATPIADIADNDATSPLTNLYVSLHTADPTDTGNQQSSEATYTGYARKDIARNNGAPAWTIGTGTAENTAAVTFAPCTAGSNTITHFAVGSLVSGAGRIFYSGALSASLAVSAGITPQFGAGALDITED